jgi:hypothetical protein
MPDANAGLYRVKVEERGGTDGTVRRVLVLHVYRDGVEAEAHEYELSGAGCHGLVDEVRWQEFQHGG